QSRPTVCSYGPSFRSVRRENVQCDFVPPGRPLSLAWSGRRLALDGRGRPPSVGGNTGSSSCGCTRRPVSLYRYEARIPTSSKRRRLENGGRCLSPFFVCLGDEELLYEPLSYQRHSAISRQGSMPPATTLLGTVR